MVLKVTVLVVAGALAVMMMIRWTMQYAAQPLRETIRRDLTNMPTTCYGIHHQSSVISFTQPKSCDGENVNDEVLANQSKLSRKMKGTTLQLLHPHTIPPALACGDLILLVPKSHRLQFWKSWVQWMSVGELVKILQPDGLQFSHCMIMLKDDVVGEFDGAQVLTHSIQHLESLCSWYHVIRIPLKSFEATKSRASIDLLAMSDSLDHAHMDWKATRHAYQNNLKDRFKNVLPSSSYNLNLPSISTHPLEIGAAVTSLTCVSYVLWCMYAMNLYLPFSKRFKRRQSIPKEALSCTMNQLGLYFPADLLVNDRLRWSTSEGENPWDIQLASLIVPF